MKNQREASPETAAGDCPPEGDWALADCCHTCGFGAKGGGWCRNPRFSLDACDDWVALGCVGDCPGHTPATEVQDG